MELSKDKKVAIVTGAGGGMGYQICKKLAGMDFQVIGFDVVPGAFEKVGPLDNVEYWQVNVTDPDEAREKINAVAEAAGRIDALVCAAGIMEDVTPSETFPIDLWKKVIDIDLNGAFYCCQAVLPIMKNQEKSHIINIVSGAAVVPCPGLIAYAAAKAGLAAVTRTLAKEYGKYGIRVNGLMPGRTKTPMMIGRFEVDNAENVVPIGRFGKPEDQANLVGFLLSDEADFIHGALINISGGMSID